MAFNLRATVHGHGLGRSLTELHAMPADHILRDHDRLMDLYDRIAAAMQRK